MDLSLEWRVTGSLSLVASAETLFNLDVPTAVTGDGVRGFRPPRQFRIGLLLGR